MMMNSSQRCEKEGGSYWGAGEEGVGGSVGDRRVLPDSGIDGDGEKNAIGKKTLPKF